MDGAERVPLGRSGVAVSRLGIGGGSLASAAGEAGVRGVVDAAWAAGLRHFDTAALYAGGESERRLGRALAGRPREAFVLSTKVGRYRDPHGRDVFDYSAAGATRAVEQALTRLGLARLDLVFVHDVIPELHAEAYERRFGEAVEGALPALRELQRAGVIGAVGVALRDPDVLLRFARAAPLDAVMLAGGCSLLDRSALAAFLPHCDRHGIGVLVAAPFETGLLATGPHPGARFRYRAATPEVMARASALQAACARYGVPLAAPAIQFPLRQPAVANVVVGHQSPEEVAANLRLLATDLPDALWQEIESLVMCKGPATRLQ